MSSVVAPAIIEPHENLGGFMDYLANIDYTCPIGGTFDQDITITVSDGTFDLSNYSAKSDIEKNDIVKESFTCTISGDTLTLYLTPAQTKIFEKGNYDYDVKLTNTSDPNDVVYLIGGTVRFEPVITE